MGVAVWPMVELEADDALASAARDRGRGRARRAGLHLDARQGPRAVRPRRPRRAGRPQERGRSATPRACARSSASPPQLIPDSSRSSATRPTATRASRGIGPKTAARLIAQYGPIEKLPAEALGDRASCALLFKRLATLRDDAPLFDDVDELRWRGPTAAFPAAARMLEDERLVPRVRAIAEKLGEENPLPPKGGKGEGEGG